MAMELYVVKKILFLCPYYFDIYKIFQAGIERFSNCLVDVVVYKKEKFEYKGFQRAQNFFARNILRKNMKPIWKSFAHVKDIANPEQYDYMLVLCPDVLHVRHLEYLCSKVGRSIVYYWDGFDHFPAYKDSVKYFDVCYTFDPFDARKYGLKFITNFHFEQAVVREFENDLFFLSTYDSRYPELERIVSSFERNNMKVSVHQYSVDAALMAAPKSASIHFFDQQIAFGRVNEMLRRSRFVLDLQKRIQRGLTFRVFEAMGYRKKLITTNADIVNYDFYDPNNIFVWREDTDSLPSSFLESPYVDLPDDIFYKYSQENWVKTVFDS